MSNKYLRSQESAILKNKLDRLARTLQASIASPDFYTSEQYLNEAVKTLSSFYRQLDTPVLDKESLPHVGHSPNADDFNTTFRDLADNLETIFNELENVESLVLANFNSTITGSSRIQARLKKILSLTQDYQLYTGTTRGVTLVRDSFTSTDRIELNSKLLNEDQCRVSTPEGIVTLSIDTAKDSRIKIYNQPTINPNSNGIIGNNYQLDADLHNDISTITDYNPDTWFEYEKVILQSQDNNEPLILDITLNLGNPQIINYVRLNPNNFGQRTSIKIDTIETSLDGKSFISVKDDIPIAGYLTEDEENVFVLAPSSSKYAGQGFFTFTPRKAKYVHFILSQSEAYLIDTSTGVKRRYAIGIRDIEIRSLVFKPIGEVVSQLISLNQPVSKISLQATQSPSGLSTLANISHFVSPDNGITWLPIRPQTDKGLAGLTSEIPEIVNFNNASNNSFDSNIPVLSLRWKAILERDDTAFTSTSEGFYTVSAKQIEFRDQPRIAPHSIKLEKTPIRDSVKLVDPCFGSCGIQRAAYKIGTGQARTQYSLPAWDKIWEKRPTKKEASGNLWKTVLVPDSEWINLIIGNKKWTIATSALTNYSSSDTVYNIDWRMEEGPTLFFGNDTNGQAPKDTDVVSLYFEREKLFPINGVNSPVQLSFPTGAEKKQISIYRYSELKNGAVAITQGTTIVKLPNKNISDITSSMSPYIEQSFINGIDELSGSKYSIDKENGIIYFSSPNTTIKTISYTYTQVDKLKEEDWDWGTVGELNDSVVLKDSAWITVPYNHSLETSGNISSPTKYFELPHQSIVKKSLVIETTGTISPFQEEVPFLNGLDELSNLIYTEEKISSLQNSSYPANVTFSLTENITSDSDATVSFTNSGIFIIEDASLDDVGDYSIDKSGNTVTVRVDQEVTEPGSIFYFYERPSSTTVSGLYSVDYKNGVIYTGTSFSSMDVSSIECRYRYSDFRIDYPIARSVKSSDYTVNYNEKTIVITNYSETATPDQLASLLPARYQISYDYVQETREDVSLLKDYFTPIIKDYSLKIIPQEL
jgi:hypothetical protein